MNNKTLEEFETWAMKQEYRPSLFETWQAATSFAWKTELGEICEGYTMPHDLRKRLENLLWNPLFDTAPLASADAKRVKVCIGYVVKGEPLHIPDGEYLLIPAAIRQQEDK